MAQAGAWPRWRTLLSDPWVGGQNQFGTTVAAPHRGTLIGPAGVRSDLRDDPRSEAVRTELKDRFIQQHRWLSDRRSRCSTLPDQKKGLDIEPRQYNHSNAPAKHSRFP